MADVFDYLKWRGDLSFAQDPPGEVDAMIFSSIVYTHFQGNLLLNPNVPIPLHQAAKEFRGIENIAGLARMKKDVELFMAAAETPRFRDVRMVRYQSDFLPEEDTQFAAVTFLLEDATCFLAFRGTDNTLVGWREDFNMTFQQTVPSQRLAKEYTEQIHREYGLPMRLCGHSKGGNIAVYAALKSAQEVRDQIVAVYNLDGPGFTEYTMEEKCYRSMVPRIRTFVPQASVVGLLLQHQEPFTVIHSDQVSLLQHDTYSWEVMGRQLVRDKELTAESRHFNHALMSWLSTMDRKERSRLVDTLFDLLESGDADSALDILQPKNVLQYLRHLGSDDSARQLLSTEFQNFVDVFRRTRGSETKV